MSEKQKDKNKYIIFTRIVYINLIMQFCDPISIINCLRLNASFLEYFMNSDYDSAPLDRVTEMLDCYLCWNNDYLTSFEKLLNNEKESIHFLNYLLYKRFGHRPLEYCIRGNLPKYLTSDKEYMVLIFEAHFKISHEDCYFLEFYNLNRIAAYLNLIKKFNDNANIIFPWRKFLLRRWLKLFLSTTVWDGLYFHRDSINLDFFTLEIVLEFISLMKDYWIRSSFSDAIRSAQKSRKFDNDVLIKWSRSYIKKFQEPLFCRANFESYHLEKKLFCDNRPIHGDYCRYHKEN